MATAASREALVARIRHFFEAFEGTYGYRRIHADLAAEGTECSAELVRQIIRQQTLVPYQPRPFRATTLADDLSAATMSDLVQLDFTADQPGVKFVGDITHILTWQGFVYLATVIDCYSKKVVGWAIDDHMRAELVETALRNAAESTLIAAEAIWHDDRGSQGGFNWSPQHLEWEVCDDTSTAERGSGDQAEAPVAGTSEVPTSRRGRVLGADREGPAGGGSRRGRRSHSALGYRSPNEVQYSDQQSAMAA